MRNRIYLTIALFAIATSTVLAQDFAAFEKKSYTSKKGFTLPYRQLQPVDFDVKKKYPLVVFLHGAGERGNDNESQLKHGGALFSNPDIRTEYPAFVIFPQCPRERVWYYNKALDGLHPNADVEVNKEITAVKELIDQLVATGNIDTRRIYITGISMGGFGTFGIVSLNPDLFAAAAPICGGAVLTDIPKYAKLLPFWVFHGGSDPIVHPKFSREAVKALEEAGGVVKYTEYKGVEHSSWDNVFSDPKYLKWLFSQHK